ncbi:unnamed protein product [Clonostachys byssicola]|uniref:AB hydrolase-1 domain-containing protein n=1 Tax=Clonostachys byssicola TaxID=160290 RepID=A0A9N9UFF5_9HYPO|nr:unnamed protein product [Clonostachys byssicola]
MSSKPTIVIVPGAWQMPAVWTSFQKKLNGAGYPTEYIKLKTVGGEELPLAGLEDDIAEVRSVLDKLSSAGKRAVLLCHSYGGIVGSNSVEGSNAVDGMIFLAAFLLPKNKSLKDMLGGNPLPWMIMQEDCVVGNPDLMNEIMFNDLDPEEQTKWAKEMTHTSAQPFAIPSTYEPWANGIPCSYIACSNDNGLPYPLQQQLWEQLGSKPKVVTLEAGHCPFLSAPDELLAAINEVVA